MLSIIVVAANSKSIAPAQSEQYCPLQNITFTIWLPHADLISRPVLQGYSSLAAIFCRLFISHPFDKSVQKMYRFSFDNN